MKHFASARMDPCLFLACFFFFPCDVSFSPSLVIITLHAAPCTNVPCPKKKERRVNHGTITDLATVGSKKTYRNSVTILPQAISCSNVRGVFPVHERFWFCLVQVSATQFCSFPSFLMARANDGTDVLVSPLPASSSNLGSPNGSLPDLE